MTNEELRQRLIELCDTNNGWVDEVPADKFADYLIKNGVTIRERGEWKPMFNDSYCSVCGYENKADTVTRVRDNPPFCPHCGADLRGGNDE